MQDLTLQHLMNAVKNGCDIFIQGLMEAQLLRHRCPLWRHKLPHACQAVPIVIGLTAWSCLIHMYMCRMSGEGLDDITAAGFSALWLCERVQEQMIVWSRQCEF